MQEMNEAYWNMMSAIDYSSIEHSSVQQMILMSAADAGVFLPYPAEPTEAALDNPME